MPMLSLTALHCTALTLLSISIATGRKAESAAVAEGGPRLGGPARDDGDAARGVQDTGAFRVALRAAVRSDL